MLLYCTRSSVFVEYTLGNAGKHIDHGVNSFLLRCIRELQYSQTIAEEFAIEESVHQIELTDYIDEAQNLAGEVPIHVRVVIPYVHHQVIHENTFLLRYVVLGIHTTIHSHDQCLHQAAFPETPQPLRYITQNRLEEQHEADPLIVRVVFPCLDISEVVGHSWMCHLRADLSIERVWHGERGCYPAISIDGRSRQTLDDACYRVTDVLGGRDEQRAREQQYRGEVVMQTK